MLIIIEGVDKTGKTTLANHLMKSLPKTFMIKVGDLPKNDSYADRHKIQDYYRTISASAKLYFKDYILIQDRSIFSEIAYSFKRGYNALEDKDTETTFQDLISLNKINKVIVIYCKTDIEEIKKKFIEDGEDYAKPEEIETILANYEEGLSRVAHFIEVWRYDYRDVLGTKEQIVRRLKLKLNIED